MRERPDVVQESSGGEEVKRKRFDLSVPQVAGSAVAAVVAAELASCFGVYGTILGAGLVSVVATCGGSVLQHFFTRTGEQLRDAAVPAPVTGQGLRDPREFGEGTVHRAWVRGHRRPLLAAVLVFGVSMAGVTTYELVSGSSFGGKGGTTVGDAFSGHGGSSPDSEDSGDRGDPGGAGDPGDSGNSGSASGSGSGSGSDSGEDGSAPTPSGTPDTPGGATPSDGTSSGGGATGGSAPAPAPDESGEGEQGTGEEPAVTPTTTGTRYRV